MEEIIKQVYAQKLEDGTVEKIVGNAVDEMIRDVCRDMIGYNGTAYKLFKERLSPVFAAAVESSNLGDMTAKLTEVINEGMKGTNLEAYAKLLEGVKTLCGAPKVTLNQTVKLSEVFKAYCDYVSRHYDLSDFDDDEITEDGDIRYADVTCTLETEKSDSAYYRTRKVYEIKLSNDKGANDEDGTCFAFSIVQDYGSGIRLKTKFNLDIRKIAYLDEFELYLLMLDQNWANIELDINDGEEQATIED